MTCCPKDNTVDGVSTHAPRAKIYENIDGDEYFLPFWDNNWGTVQPKDSGEDPGDWNSSWTYSLEGVENLNTIAGAIHHWTDFALGQVNRLIAEAAKEKRFTMPFFVRWAYRLYDGSHVMHSDPVLMIPGSKYPVFAMDADRGFRVKDTDNDNRKIWFEGRAYGFTGLLMARIVNDSQQAAMTALDDWKDIVTDIDIYVSAPIYTYHQDGKIYGWTNMEDEGAWDDFYTHGSTSWTGHTDYTQHSFEDIFKLWNASSGEEIEDRYYHAYDSNHPLPCYILTMPEKSKDDILRAVESPSYYKVASYKIDDYDLFRMHLTDVPVNINDGVIESLVARETLPDDYHSRDTLKADYAFAYNNRVNLSGIKRTLHSPLPPSSSWPKDDHTQRSWTIKVEYKNGGATRVMPSSGENGCVMPRYIFYPDRHATTAYLSYDDGGTTHKWKLALTEHPHLEGAYWYGGMAKEVNEEEMAAGDAIPADSVAPVEEVSNVYTSDVNNPFVFPLLGINTVGTGKVIGLCSAVKALSQGQFGAFPLYAFSTDGVWAMQINDEGAYKAVQPITRDVCVDAGSITQLDDSVLFATDRGIMLLSGSNTVCISEQIDDKGATFDATTLPGLSEIIGNGMQYAPFRDFLDGCRMVYDYVKQRIIVYNANYGYAYVYSLDTKKWGMMDSEIKDTINAYPNALVVVDDGTDGKIADIDGKDDDDPLTGIQGVLVTRPLKLDYPDNLKTVRTVIQRGFFDYADTTRQVKPVRQVLFGSRDLFNWFPVWSSADQYLRGFSGTPYKYFRLALICDLKETEKLVGCTVEYYPRFTNQPR
jgi:hypothetical protein